MSNEIQIDANDLVNALSEQIAGLSRDLAFARAQVIALQKQVSEGEVTDGS